MPRVPHSRGAARRATITPLVKAKAGDDGDGAAEAEPDVRPIGIGEVERRIIAAAVNNSFTEAFAEYLTPQQLAVGVGGGLAAARRRRPPSVPPAGVTCH